MANETLEADEEAEADDEDDGVLSAESVDVVVVEVVAQFTETEDGLEEAIHVAADRRLDISPYDKSSVPVWNKNRQTCRNYELVSVSAVFQSLRFSSPRYKPSIVQQTLKMSFLLRTKFVHRDEETNLHFRADLIFLINIHTQK